MSKYSLNSIPYNFSCFDTSVTFLISRHPLDVLIFYICGQRDLNTQFLLGRQIIYQLILYPLLLVYYKRYYSYIRLFLGGRHPLWHIGVLSLIVQTTKPIDLAVFATEKRPLPIPLMKIEINRMLRSLISLSTFSITTCAV